AFYSNPEADRLMEEGRRELDQSKRKAIYQQLHALLADDQPYAWTLQVSSKWAVNKRLRDVKESKGWGLFNWVPGELGWWIPGDPITVSTSQHMTHLSQAALDAIRHEHHLDQPLVAQYLYWLRSALLLDFGASITDHRPVTDRILEKLPHTFELNAIAFLLAAA